MAMTLHFGASNLAKLHSVQFRRCRHFAAPSFTYNVRVYKQRVNGPDNLRWLSSSEPEAKKGNEDISDLLYEGPFASLSLRLKRVSITSAVVSLIGVPLLVALHGGDVPGVGQLAVGGTAVFAATGSTIALHYCFSPYVHMLERIPAHDPIRGSGEFDATNGGKDLLKATTRSIATMKVETVFDPATDVTQPTGNRPFCNFLVRGIPMYIHPEMIYDESLRIQLVGERKEEEHESNNKDDDEFL
mmetsp:Transcript_45265/g.137906  ORF Transcript_45265/g.137906 Transcript_45265/m.137906 type:complete len:244 (-) Transcript_45265:115-846(-)|eukprot:CAMPEP_0113530496 /NCGR_PEP_ID=MMETSP0015_2-20120614/2970_1 /TAXON_ID=2838 /ORGANISM="Odontella" /LENGTH=243 /DNA_ID=CAMNT_0000429221 /DNA_START=15 /DNA_END=746 /DNA_ORIENTATION=- /assembly_acc=CAM_ASM_000160